MLKSILYVFLIIAPVLVAILIVFVPRTFASKYKSRYDISDDVQVAKLESETRTAMVQLALGSAGFFVLWTAIESLDATNRNIEVNKQIQLDERFSKAVTLVMGNKEAMEIDQVARAAGVYALGSIAESGDEYYSRVSIGLLSAFVRREWGTDSSNSYCTELDSHPDISPYAPPRVLQLSKPDLDAAMRVIAKQTNSGDYFELNLSHVDLCMAFLLGARFAGAQLRDSDLRGAILEQADLRGAVLEFADLTGAHLANTRLGGAVLRGTRLDIADLSCADLSGADMSNATLRDANLSGANLRSARNLQQEQLSGACYSRDAMPPLLPPGLRLEECSGQSMWNKGNRPHYGRDCPRAKED